MKKITLVSGLVALAAMAITPLSNVRADDQPPADSGLGLDTKAVPVSATGSYIVVMAADPLVASFAASDLDTPQAEAQGNALEASHDEVLADAGIAPDSKVQDYTNALNGFSAALDHDAAERLAANPKVALVLADELRQVTSDSHGDPGHGSGSNDNVLNKYLGLTDKGEAYKSGVTGEGVIVGVIDTGIWPEHPSFADDGSYSDLGITLDDTEIATCDFGNTAHNPNDAPFTCNNKLLGARQMLATYRFFVGADPDEFDSARDDDGHGTHTASTAAGNANVNATIFGRPFGKVSGIAPRARIIAYKGLGNLGGFTSDLAAAIDQAVADGVDVINYSIGGGPDLTGADAIAMLFAADAGVAIAVSAANAGPGPATIGGPADTPWVTTVGANTQKNVYAGEIRLDNGKVIEGASVTHSTGKLQLVDAANAGDEFCAPGALDPTKVAGKIVLCLRGVTTRAEKSLAVFQAGGAGMILYNANDVDNLFTDNHWVPSVMIDYTPGVQIKNYIASKGSKAKATLIVGGNDSWKNAPTMAIFSSRGPNPTAADVIKPDITAPGVQVLAGNSPFPDPDTTPAGELFQAIAGTSMSSPTTAGVLALMKQAHPDWSPAAIKSALMTTANTKVKDNDRVTQASPFAMGAGEVDPGRVGDRGSAFNPGLVYDAGFFEYLGFMCDAAPAVFQDPDATCAALAGAGFPTDASDLNLASIGVADLAGSQTVTRTVTSVANKTVTWKVNVSAPKGYKVDVSPKWITLAPGASASYEVTITSKGTAPLGEWRFGSLTWSGGGYGARSAIAVRGVQVNVPADIAATGGSGTTSVAVHFGYTGPYTVEAHGLAAAETKSAHIEQDPDQTFDPNDPVGVVGFPFVVDNASFVRWEMEYPTEPGLDLDLYLLDSGGNLVAASTGGGTAHESIDLANPVQGASYTLYVHGWAVAAAGFNFDMSQWVVPASTGGSLVIDSAPASATIGTVGTVNLSWSGVPAAKRQLGYLMHSDGAGVIATTIVVIDG